MIKISDEELEFITGEADEDKAIQSLFEGSVEQLYILKVLQVQVSF